MRNFEQQVSPMAIGACKDVKWIHRDATKLRCITQRPNVL